MARQFNYERAAIALADSIALGDRAAAKKHKVSVKSIENWRKRLDSDPILREFFQQKKQALEEAWADRIPVVLSAQLDFLKRASQDADTKSPEVIHAIAGALKLTADIELTKKMVDARLAQ